jgi:hypothetical protein
MPAAGTPNPNESCADAELEVMGRMPRILHRRRTAGDGGDASGVDGVHRQRSGWDGDGGTTGSTSGGALGGELGMW